MTKCAINVFRKCTLLLIACSAILSAAPVSAQDNPDQSTAGTMPGEVNTPQDSSETYRQLNLFGDVFERVRAQYVDEVKDKELIETAINGMLMALDPHSSYLNNEEFDDMRVQTRGEFGGLGIEVTMENGIIKVVSPIDDTPAYRAGVKAGDYITHLDDQPIIGLSLNEAVDKMRGKIGTNIKLTIRRTDVPDAIELVLTRDVIKISPIKHELVEGDIGYVRITQFNQNTDSGLKKAVADIKEKAGQKLIGFIIDLRNNPGGLLDQAVAVSDDFLDKGEIVSTRGRHEEGTKRDNATEGDITDGLPVVVLINGGSASASEIVAGALQDHRRAILLGTKSFGKGSVQTVIPLPGHGAMRLTTARYYTPSGRSIQAKGIEPDILVEQAKIEKQEGRYMKESDLPGALENPDKEKDGKKNSAPVTGQDKADEGEAPKDKDKNKGDDTNKSKDQDKKKPDSTSVLSDQDYQLTRAIDLIHGLSLYGKRQ